MSYSRIGSSGSASVSPPGGRGHRSAHADQAVAVEGTHPAVGREDTKTMGARAGHVPRDTMRKGPSGDRARSAPGSELSTVTRAMVWMPAARHVRVLVHDTFRTGYRARSRRCCTC